VVNFLLTTILIIITTSVLTRAMHMWKNMGRLKQKTQKDIILMTCQKI